MYSVVPNKVHGQFELFATNSAQKRSLSRVGSHVFGQLSTTLTASATFCTLVFLSMNIHMTMQVATIRITFLTQSTWINVVSGISLTVLCQLSSSRKPFVTHRTQIQPGLVVICMLRDIRAVSFRLRLRGTPCTNTNRCCISVLLTARNVLLSCASRFSKLTSADVQAASHYGKLVFKKQCLLKELSKSRYKAPCHNLLDWLKHSQYSHPPGDS